MGMLEKYGIDLENDVDETAAGGDYNVPDGTYDFILSSTYEKEGTEKHPDKVWTIYEYLVGETGKKFTEWFVQPADPQNLTSSESFSLSKYKARVLSLGVPVEDLNTFEDTDLEGIEGVFELKTTRSKRDGKDYQNIAHLWLEGDADAPSDLEPAEEAEPEPAPSAPVRRPAAKAATATTRPAVKRDPFAKK